MSFEFALSCVVLVCCYCTMLSILFCVLFAFIPLVGAVCQFCFGEATPFGCTGDVGTCPWNIGVTENATTTAAIIAGTATTTALAISKLLPIRFRKLFPRNVMTQLGNILGRPRNGVEFDPDGKTLAEVIRAISGGTFTKQDALIHWTTLMTELSPDDENYESEVIRLKTQISVIKEIAITPSSSDADTSAQLFTLAKLSQIHCKNKDLLISLDDQCSPCDDGETESSSSSSSSKLVSSSTLLRPKSSEKMYALLNDWVLFSLALGTSPLVMLPFLSDVVYIPVAEGVLEWPVAFELLLIYLNEIERNPDVWNMANVFAKSGAIDVRRAQADLMARARYPATSFRARGGNPGKSRITDDALASGLNANGGVDLSRITKHNTTCKRGCHAWNNCIDHLSTHVDANGRCKYFHGCNQWVSDKGPGGQCLGAHKRVDCTYDPTKKLDKALK